MAQTPALHNSTPSVSTTPAVAVPAQGNKRTATKRVFKVILIGDAGVGKTCLSFRFCNGRFPDNTEATIGVDFRERGITIDDEVLRVQLWDTAGQERYRASMMSHYYRNVNAVVFVYDMTSRTSFTNLKHWFDECEYHSDCADVPRILIGNKCDCTNVAVMTDEAQRFADAHDMPLFETSAKADSQADHVESIFMTLVHKLRESKPMHVQSDNERIRVQQQRDAEKAAAEAEGGMCC